MHPAARIAASIEVLEQLFSAWEQEKRAPADATLERYFKARRFMGAKDRGAVAELVYWVLRHKASLEWWLAQLFSLPHPALLPGREGSASLPRAGEGRLARMLILAALVFRHEYSEALFGGHPHAPAPLTRDETAFAAALSGKPLLHPDMPSWVQLNYPEWLHAELESVYGADLERFMHAMNEQAPVDLRANTLKTTRDALLAALRAEGMEAHPAPLSPWGVRLSRRAPVFTLPLFKQGHFEMQDAGSQVLALLTDAEAGQKIIDFCAGAGGKTLAIAAMMNNKGRILALDISASRLQQLKPRLARAGVDNVMIHAIASETDSWLKRHRDTADCVLVDAPCSGSGTWRRNPDLKWRFSPEALNELLAVQECIMNASAKLVKPGGRLIYATCSTLESENEAQVQNFLKVNPIFRVVSVSEIWDKTLSPRGKTTTPFLRLAPHQDGVDGFFAAVFERAG